MKAVEENSRAGHTAGPWEARYEQMAYTVYADGQPGGLAIIACYPGEEERANAEFIVRACNVHEELLEAAEYLISHDDNDPDSGLTAQSYDEAWTELRNAVAKARGQA